METENNINMKKIDEITARPSAYTSRTLETKIPTTSFFENHKKPILIIIFILIILSTILFFFKDILFKDKINEPIGPQNYQEAIDQSFKEGYKTDYTYNAEIIKQINEVNVKSEKKIKPSSKAVEQALLDRINN
jgi:ABC-type dipeptide/oligopeptide/nickel transport system permease component